MNSKRQDQVMQDKLALRVFQLSAIFHKWLGRLYGWFPSLGKQNAAVFQGLEHMAFDISPAAILPPRHRTEDAEP